VDLAGCDAEVEAVEGGDGAEALDDAVERDDGVPGVNMRVTINCESSIIHEEHYDRR